MFASFYNIIYYNLYHIPYSIYSYLSNVFYVYHPIVGTVQLAAPIKGMTNGGRELALVRPSAIPFIENRRFCPK